MLCDFYIEDSYALKRWFCEPFLRYQNFAAKLIINASQEINEASREDVSWVEFFLLSTDSFWKRKKWDSSTCSTTHEKISDIL
jgi:hypothetical protein